MNSQTLLKLACSRASWLLFLLASCASSCFGQSSGSVWYGQVELFCSSDYCYDTSYNFAYYEDINLNAWVLEDYAIGWNGSNYVVCQDPTFAAGGCVSASAPGTTNGTTNGPPTSPTNPNNGVSLYFNALNSTALNVYDHPAYLQRDAASLQRAAIISAQAATNIELQNILAAAQAANTQDETVRDQLLADILALQQTAAPAISQSASSLSDIQTEVTTTYNSSDPLPDANGTLSQDVDELYSDPTPELPEHQLVGIYPGLNIYVPTGVPEFYMPYIGNIELPVLSEFSMVRTISGGLCIILSVTFAIGTVRHSLAL